MPTGYARAALAAVTLIACANVRQAGHAPIVVPFELRGDLALVTVSVNGHPTVLILDTGSGALVLDSAFARLAGVEMSLLHAQAVGSRSTPIRIGTARTVRVGSAPLSNVMVAVVNFADVQARAGQDVHGAVGFELFDRYVVAIDYSDSTIVLYEPKEFTYRGAGTVLPVNIERRLPVVNASIVTRKHGTIGARLHLDLGSTNYSLRLATRFVAAHDLAHDTVTVTGPFGAGVGGVTEGQLLRMLRLELGNLTIERPSTALSHSADGAFGTTSAADGTIGVPVLRRTHLIIDYSRSRVILEPRGGLDAPDPVDASGLTLTAEETPTRTLRVSYVIAGSSGADAGVRVGDELLGTDDTPASLLTVDHARALLREAGSTRRLTLRRGGTTVEVSLTLRMVF